MRKLKTVLVILFSLMMSLCLFACTPKEPEDPNKDPETPSETEGKVTSVRFQSDTATVTLTDAEVAAAADDAARAALVQEAAGDLNVQVTVSGESRVQVVKGDVLTYDFSKVDWDAVGNYLASAKLMSTDKFDCGEEGVALTNSLNIRIDHAFGEPDETGTASCQCGAAKTVFELGEGEYESVIVGSKGNFHGGTANDTSKGDLELLTPFGTVDQGDYKTVVNTMTAGTIRKGMTVTLYGTAQNYSPLPDASVWYYPNIGIALRDFDASTSLFKSSPNYQGGMSVIVRADGWVLMDGIGDNGVSRYGTRMLAGLVGGGDNTYNYSSNGSNTNLPAAWGDFDPLNPPADTSTWGDWAASSVGTALSTGTFTDAQEISLSYTFRNDNIIELVYTVYNGSGGAAGDTLTARIKIPDEYADASFDTIVHADYTEMRFDRMEVVEQQKLEEVVFTGLGDDAIKNYVAGQAFNLEDLEGNVKVKYANDDRQVDPESFSLQVKRGEEWVTLGETDRLLVTDKDFRIMVKSGSVTAYDEMSLGDDDFISSITENSVTEVYGSGESAALGNVGFGSDNGSPAKVVITPVGRAVAAPSDAGKGTGYIVLRVYGTDLGTPATSGIAEILEGANKDYFDVKVTTGGDVTSATITGAQDTDIVIDVSKVTAPIYSVQITDIAVEGYTGELTAIPANTGATVTVVYTVDSETYASAKVGVSTSNAMLVATDALEKSGEFRGGVAYTSKVKEANGVTTLTLTLSYGPMEIGGDAYALVNFRTTENNLTYIYYGEPVAAEGSPVVEVGGNKGYFTVDGGKLCFVVVKATENIVETDLTIGDMVVNVNAGGKDLKFTEIGAKYENGLVVYNDEDVAAAGTINATFTFNGTLDSDNAYDVDNSFVIVQSIDIAKLGITDTADFYFEYGVTQDEMNAVHVTKDGIVPVTIDSALETIVAGGDCFTTSIQAKPLKDADGNVVFYGGLVIIPAEHKWGADNAGVFTCTACGAVTKNDGTQWTLGAEMFEGVTEAGLTVTMNTSGVTGDWGAVALVSGQHNAIITLPNLDPFNMVTDGMTDAEKAIAGTLTGTNFFPGAEDLFNGGVWNSFVNTTATPSNYATIVVEPGEAGGISYYLNGVLVVKYAYGRVNNTGGDKTGTAGDYVELFLMLVERTGLIVAKGGITAADAVVYSEALDATQIATLYANNSEEGYYPVHVHSYETDIESENYDFCACGAVNPEHSVHAPVLEDDPATEDYNETYICRVCGEPMPDHVHSYDEETEECIYCGAVNPNHNHVYEDDPESEQYGYCECGQFDPNHGTENGTAHIFVDAFCTACGAYDTTHTHTFVDGVCVCGGREISVAVGDVTYEGEVSYTAIQNNDTDPAWWNGSTSSVALADNTAVVFTWENTRDKNYYDYAVEVVYNLGGKVGDQADGQYIDFDQGSQWVAEWVSATAPTLSGTTTGTQAAAGAENAGYGTYVATVVRVGTTVVCTVEFTANGSDTVTWTRTATVTGCPAEGSPIVQISGNPVFLDNIHAYTGTVAAE